MPIRRTAFSKLFLSPALICLAAASLLAVLSVPPARAQSSTVRSVAVHPEAKIASPSAPLTKREIRRAMVPNRTPVRTRLANKETSPSTALLALAGTGGWLLGATAGAGLGYLLLDYKRNRFLPLGTFVGGLGGLLLGAPLGVHLANGRDGNYVLDFLVSAGAGIGSAMLLTDMLNTGKKAQGALAIGLPIALQIGTAVAVEKSTAR